AAVERLQEGDVRLQPELAGDKLVQLAGGVGAVVRVADHRQAALREKVSLRTVGDEADDGFAHGEILEGLAGNAIVLAANYLGRSHEQGIAILLEPEGAGVVELTAKLDVRCQAELIHLGLNPVRLLPGEAEAQASAVFGVIGQQSRDSLE